MQSSNAGHQRLQPLQATALNYSEGLWLLVGYRFRFLRVGALRAELFRGAFFGVFARADFFFDFLDAAFAGERFFVVLRGFFAGKAFFVTLPPLPAGVSGAEGWPSALQSTFFCDCRLAGSGMPAKRQRSRYLISFGL